MGNTLRCCIACMLPCGALDVVRIVHMDGYVEELSRTVKAEEVMKANPKHVLRKSTCQGIVHGIVVLPPDAELERGKIYFLIPVSSLKRKADENSRASSKSKNRQLDSAAVPLNSKSKSKSKAKSAVPPANGRHGSVRERVVSEQYLADVISEKYLVNHENGRPGRHGRRRSRVGVWRPHLESIAEVDLDSV